MIILSFWFSDKFFGKAYSKNKLMLLEVAFNLLFELTHGICQKQEVFKLTTFTIHSVGGLAFYRYKNNNQIAFFIIKDRLLFIFIFNI